VALRALQSSESADNAMHSWLGSVLVWGIVELKGDVVVARKRRPANTAAWFEGRRANATPHWAHGIVKRENSGICIDTE
jgi:hypothetical protein